MISKISPKVGQVLGAIALLASSTAVSAQEASSNRVAANTDWSVFVETDPTECWAVSAPKETVNSRDGQVVSVRRGEILLFVFYRPGAGVQGQVTFTGGYPFASGSTAELDIGGTKFELFTEGEWAWPATPEADAQIVAAMKRGAEAVVSARSGRGTVTRDSFSLLGFTAGVEEAANRCS
ncbi:invasion associated locus B family protein [Octadecabacter sp.]|nr:invasion associated locus B family protein [Octadecabacter sp.]